jgi:uncharacterized protein
VRDDNRDRPATEYWLSIALWFVSLTLATPIAATAAAPPPGPSFACAKPSEIEALVCRDPELAAADRRMAAFYGLAKTGALGSGSSQPAAQREWLKDRDKDCALGSWTRTHKGLRACVAGEYDERLKQLAIANLMASPKESLAELGRIGPKSLPLYRAAHDYAAIDDRKRRTAVVAKDLAPVYPAMDEDTRDRISGQSSNGLATAQDAAASDENFAAVFALYSAEGDEDLTWPCAVLVRRPGLIRGLGSYFGSSMDAHIPESDCEDALPPMGAVDALVGEALRVQPEQEGTIRFAYEREYVKLQTAVRLHQTEEWETKAGKAKSAGVSMTREERAWRRMRKAEIETAETELAAYYVKYFAVVPERARSDAIGAVDTLIGNAFASDD